MGECANGNLDLLIFVVMGGIVFEIVRSIWGAFS